LAETIDAIQVSGIGCKYVIVFNVIRFTVRQYLVIEIHYLERRFLKAKGLLSPAVMTNEILQMLRVF